MAKRFIDADDFYKRQAKRCFYNIPILGTCTMDKISLREALKEQPTADVVEVRHGEWINDGNCFHCTDCGKTYGLGSLQTIYDVKRCWAYCPSCGAKMDKGVIA